MLSDNDKRVLKSGTLEQQMYLLMEHWHDKDDVWIIEARAYFKKSNPHIFKEVS